MLTICHEHQVPVPTRTPPPHLPRPRVEGGAECCLTKATFWSFFFFLNQKVATLSPRPIAGSYRGMLGNTGKVTELQSRGNEAPRWDVAVSHSLQNAQLFPSLCPSQSQAARALAS